MFLTFPRKKRARFENSPLLGSRPRAADSSAGEQILLKKTMMVRDFSIFFFQQPLLGARVFLRFAAACKRAAQI